MKTKLLFAGTLLVCATLLYAKTTIISTHVRIEHKDTEAAFKEARKLFTTNQWAKVVITFERDHWTSNETFTVEAIRRESSMTE